MSPIDDLRAKHKDPKRVFRITSGDIAEAIFELAKRLDELEVAQPTATESPPEPWITQIGKYQLKNGEIVDVNEISQGLAYESNHDRCWHLNGLRYFRPQGNESTDIIAGPLANEPDQQTTELTGFVTLSPDGRAYAGLAISPAAAKVKEPHIVIDLSKVPASALVKPPEPKRETVTCRFWAFKSGVIICRRKDENSWPGHVDELVSHWEQEITFTHGEGLS